MKKITAITVLLVLVLSQLGYIIIQSVQLISIREKTQQEMLTMAPLKSLERICLEDNAASIVWEEPGKEFRLQGILYDIGHRVNEGGKTILYCLNDATEEQFYNHMADALKAATGNASGSNGQPVFKYQFPDIFIAPDTGGNETGDMVATKYPHDKSANTHFLSLNINTPPPESSI